MHLFWRWQHELNELPGCKNKIRIVFSGTGNAPVNQIVQFGNIKWTLDPTWNLETSWGLPHSVKTRLSSLPVWFSAHLQLYNSAAHLLTVCGLMLGLCCGYSWAQSKYLWHGWCTACRSQPKSEELLSLEEFSYVLWCFLWKLEAPQLYHNSYTYLGLRNTVHCFTGVQHYVSQR